MLGRIRRWSRRHFSGVTTREKWGYGLWGSVGAIVAIPELWAALWSGGPWPTISGTTGHLEARWSPTAIVVVAVLVIAAAKAVRYAWRDEAAELAGRTPGGRLVRTSAVGTEAPVSGLWGYVYAIGALLCVLVPSVLVAVFIRDTSEHTKWILGYVIYGLIGLFCIVGPSALAYWAARDVPFPTLLQTVASLERRVHWVGMIVLAGLAVLLIHLAFYPWPDIPHHNPTPKAP